MVLKTPNVKYVESILDALLLKELVAAVRKKEGLTSE
jgi:hypothetical protein